MCGTKDVMTAGYPNVDWSAQRDTGRVSPPLFFSMQRVYYACMRISTNMYVCLYSVHVTSGYIYIYICVQICIAEQNECTDHDMPYACLKYPICCAVCDIRVLTSAKGMRKQKQTCCTRFKFLCLSACRVAILTYLLRRDRTAPERVFP